MQNSTFVAKQLVDFSSTNIINNSQGVLSTVPHGTTGNIDLLIADDLFITGGIIRAKNVNFGDYITIQVIDKDNVLGFGANTILGTPYSTWYMRSDVEEQFNENIIYPTKIITGVYLRVAYVSTGSTTDVQIAINYKLYKTLF